MNVCPQCGNPIKSGSLSPIKPVDCDRCGWKGTYSETLYADGLETQVYTAQQRLEVLYKRLASEIAPNVGKILIETGMVFGPDGKDNKVDKDRIQFLAKVLEGATRGTVAGIAEKIRESMNNGGN